MKYIKYSRYAPDAADDIDLQELMNRLSDFFLQSGFESPYGIYEMDMEKSREQHMDQLRQAILRALEEGDLVPQELMDKLRENPDLSQNQRTARPDRPDHPAHGRGRLHHAAAVGARDASTIANSRRPDRAGSAERRGALRDHRQGARFSGIQDAERLAGFARQEQFRAARHARFGHRRGIRRQIEGLRIRRHAEYGYQRDALSTPCSARARDCPSNSIIPT